MNSENIIRNIIKEVLKELGNLNVNVDEGLCTYYVHKEVAVVFKSVMDDKELAEFPQNLYVVRQEKLETLVKVVSGIRIFNKDCLIGGKGIPNIPSLLHDAIYAVRDLYNETLEGTTTIMSYISITLDNSYAIKRIDNKVIVDYIIPLLVKETELDYVKDLLVMYNQFQLGIRQLICHVDQMEKRTVNIKKDFDNTLEFLHSKVGRNLRLRASSVFPSFEKLFEIWQSFQNEIFTLMALKYIFDELHTYVSGLDPLRNKLVAAYAMGFLDETNVTIYKSDHHTLSAAAKTSDISAEGLQKKDLEGVIDHIKFEYDGFCCWTLALTNGVLKKGNIDNGIAKYQSRYYIFADEEGLKGFIDYPTYFIFYILEMTRKKCELITLLDLKEQLKNCAKITRLTIDVDRKHKSKGVQINVNTHVEPTKIDKDYEWNIWKLKRDTIRMADLMNSKTTSSQTKKCGTKESWACQKNMTNSHGTQTDSTKHTNTPALKNFLHGLRGLKDSDIFNVVLQTDIL